MLSYLNAMKEYGNGFLLLRSQTNFRQSHDQSILIKTLNKSRTEFPMHINGRSNDLPR